MRSIENVVLENCITICANDKTFFAVVVYKGTVRTLVDELFRNDAMFLFTVGSISS